MTKKLYHIQAEMATTFDYVVAMDHEPSVEEAQKLLNSRSLKDFQVHNSGEGLKFIRPITHDEYIVLFDTMYAAWKDIDIAQKMMQINDIDEDTITPPHDDVNHETGEDML